MHGGLAVALSVITPFTTTSLAMEKKVDSYAIEKQLNLVDYEEQLKELNEYGKEKNEDILEDNFNWLTEHGYGVEKINFGSRETIIFHDNINTNCQDKMIFCRDLDEFRQYVDVKNPTYEDVKNAITLNENIPEQYKGTIYNWLENLKQNFPNLDLVVLYYNVSTIKFEIAQQEEIEQKSNSNKKENEDKWKNINALFVKEEHKQYVQDSIAEVVLEHESEHWITEATIKKDNLTVNNTSKMIIIDGEITKNENNTIIPAKSIGLGYEEAKAEAFRRIVSNNFEEKYYEDHIKVFKILMSIADMNLEEFAEYGTRGLIQRLNEKGFNIADKVTEYDDFMFNCQLSGIYMLDGLTEEELENVIITYYAKNCYNQEHPIEFAIRDLKRLADQAGFYSDIISTFNEDRKKKENDGLILGFDRADF